LSESICKRYLVSGRVQGVFFRASAAREALRLGLAGAARNLVDGRVEVLACGTPEAIGQLERWLAVGPRLAKVSRVEARDVERADWPADDGFATG